MKARTKWGKKLKRKNSPPNVTSDGTYTTFSGPFHPKDIKEILAGNIFDNVSFRDGKFIDLVTANEIANSTVIRSLGIWSRISRAAFSRLMQIGGLKEVFVFEFAGSGRLRDFSLAAEVEVFRGFNTLRSADLIEIANLPKLNSLSAQCAEFGVKAMERLADVGSLRQVDFESVVISDAMAISLASSKSITDVVLPATRLSRAGLKSICAMPQLRYLDVWANGFVADDLDMLAGHPSLEIIEFGDMGSEPERRLKARDIIPKLEKMPSLNTVYFENVITTDDEFEYLNSRFKFRLLQEG